MSSLIHSYVPIYCLIEKQLAVLIICLLLIFGLIQLWKEQILYDFRSLLFALLHSVL